MMIYLAQPYSHPETETREHRYRIAESVAVNLMKKNYTIFAPIVHWHRVAQAYNLPTEAAFWSGHNRVMLEAAESIAVLAIYGWLDSVGLHEELEWAKELNKPAYVIRHWLQPELAHTTADTLLKEISDAKDNQERGTLAGSFAEHDGR